MGIRSMTGHGSAEIRSGGTRVAVELASVNHKQFDLRFVSSAMPAPLESRAAEMIHKRVARGSVTCRIAVGFETGKGVPETLVDEPLAAAYAARLGELADRLGLENDLGISVVAGMPGVLRPRVAEGDTAAAQPLLLGCLKQALAGLIAMRDAEGRALRADIERRMAKLDTIAGRIAARAPRVPVHHRKALLKRIKDSGLDLKQNDPRLAREAALFADRCDISEEITRLRSHMKQFSGKLSGSGSVGRTLDFMVQEMQREINTAGSKANDGRIGDCVIRFKSELERVREQVQNVE